jgi:hypothetical protein
LKVFLRRAEKRCSRWKRFRNWFDISDRALIAENETEEPRMLSFQTVPTTAMDAMPATLVDDDPIREEVAGIT